MGTQIDLGPVMMVPKGDWNAETTYERLNLVRYGAVAWVCIVDTSVGVEPGEESTDWTLLAKDTSSVTSVNGQTGDVTISVIDTETPPADDDSTRIATTEWVTDKLNDIDLSATELAAAVAALEIADVAQDEAIADKLSISGTAAATTKLATARGIDGVSFNGTADIIHYGTCETAAATAAKTVSCTGFKLVTGAWIAVRFTVTNTAASPTLNVNSTGAKAIQYRNAAISAGYLATNRTYLFVYDGSSYELVGDVDTQVGAGTGLTKSNNTLALATVVTAGNAGPTANATPAFGATFTVPYITYDAYGRVTGRTNRTVKIPSVASVTAQVTKKSTRTSNGSWTITGLTVGKPLFVLMDNGSTAHQRSVYISVTSGGIGGQDASGSNVTFLLGRTESSGAIVSTNVFVTVPTATTVVLKCQAVESFKDGVKLYAYQ